MCVDVHAMSVERLSIRREEADDVEKERRVEALVPVADLRWKTLAISDRPKGVSSDDGALSSESSAIL